MIRSDDPITTRDEDALGRDRVARVIAGEIRSLDARKGAVVAVLGPWGSGKTSVVNLARLALAEPPAIVVLDFNPWMFSGADQLVESFFTELAAQLRLGPGKLKGVADVLQAYGEVVAPLRFLPVLGPWIERFRGASKALKGVYDLRKRGVAASRRELSEKLEDLDAPIVVVIDDIDRLRTSEIRDIFKLVRLTASFPNIVYLLAFDRHRVEAALEEDHLPGRDYLEKIIQVTYDIPAIPQRSLISQITGAIDESLADIESPGPFDGQRWPDVFAEVILPLVRNMRDVRRYVASLRGTVIGLGGRVELVDVLAMEAIRVFLPDTFGLLPRSVEALTTPSNDYSFTGRHNDAVLKATIERLVESAEGRGQLMRDAIERLFPAGLRHIANNHYGSSWLATWSKERRVAHPDVLAYYLERVAGEGLESAWLAERAFDLLADRTGLDEFLRSIPADLAPDVIAALEAFENDFPKEGVVPATIVLLNLHQSLREKPRGMFGFGNDMTVSRVILRLIRRLDPGQVETAVGEILPEVTHLSDRQLLITLVGHVEGAGHKLVSEEVAAELERDLRDQVRAATPAQLAADSQTFNLIGRTMRTSADDEPPMNLASSPELARVLLLGAKSEVRGQAFGSRAVRTETRLYWDGLERIFGSDGAIRDAADLVERTYADDAEAMAIVELVRKYLTGWRPQDFPSAAGEDADDESGPKVVDVDGDVLAADD